MESFTEKEKIGDIMPTSFEKKQATPSPKKITTILMWALTGFMLVSALVFFPSLASGGMFLFACVSIPLEPVQGFLRSRGVKGWVKAVLLIILFIVCIKLYDMR